MCTEVPNKVIQKGCGMGYTHTGAQSECSRSHRHNLRDFSFNTVCQNTIPLDRVSIVRSPRTMLLMLVLGLAKLLWSDICQSGLAHRGLVARVDCTGSGQRGEHCTRESRLSTTAVICALGDKVRGLGKHSSGMGGNGRERWQWQCHSGRASWKR